MTRGLFLFFLIFISAPVLALNIFGEDTRVIMPGNEEPWSAVGLLYSEKIEGSSPTGIQISSEVCTATLISRNLILTAAHCFTDNEEKLNLDKKITFLAGYQSGQALGGEFKVYPLNLYYKDLGLNDRNWKGKDWLIARLNAPAGDRLGYMRIPSPKELAQYLRQGTNLKLGIAGYSHDFFTRLDSAGLDLNCHAHGFKDGYLIHDCATEKGSSGGAIVTQGKDGKWDQILGVNIWERSNRPEEEHKAKFEMRTANEALLSVAFYGTYVGIKEREDLRLDAIESCRSGYATTTLEENCSNQIDQYFQLYNTTGINQPLPKDFILGLYETACTVPNRRNMNLVTFATEKSWSGARAVCFKKAAQNLDLPTLDAEVKSCPSSNADCMLSKFEQVRQNILKPVIKNRKAQKGKRHSV